MEKIKHAVWVLGQYIGQDSESVKLALSELEELKEALSDAEDLLMIYHIECKNNVAGDCCCDGPCDVISTIGILRNLRMRGD